MYSNMHSTTHSPWRNPRLFGKIGINPYTHECLQDSNVAHKLLVLPDGSIDLDADPATLTLIAEEKKNTKAVNVLNDGGFNSDVFVKHAS